MSRRPYLDAPREPGTPAERSNPIQGPYRGRRRWWQGWPSDHEDRLVLRAVVWLGLLLTLAAVLGWLGAPV